MKLFEVKFSLYADNEQQAQEAGVALNKMREELLALGTVATAPHLAEAVGKWQDNSIVKNHIIRHFPKLKKK